MTDAATRLAWIRLYEASGDAAETCRRFGISRPTFRKWLRRYRADGAEGLHDRSHVPLAPIRRGVSPDVEALVLAVRQERQLGTRRLQTALHRDHGIELAIGRIRAVLRRHGMPPLAPGRRRPEAGARPAPDLSAERLPRRLPGLPKDDRLAATLADAITSGHLRPGRKLGEEELCRALAAGRTHVRQALRHLAFAGLVSIVPHRGAFVATPSPATIADAYAARCLLEGEIVAEVTRHSPAGAVAHLLRHIALQKAAVGGDRNVLVRLLTEFHLLIAALGSNRMLEEMLAGLVAQTSVAVLLHDVAPDPCAAIAEHAALVTLITVGDAAGATALMRKHLAANQARLRLADPASPGRGSDFGCTPQCLRRGAAP